MEFQNVLKKSSSSACKTVDCGKFCNIEEILDVEVRAEFRRKFNSSCPGSTACCLCNLGRLTFYTSVSLSMKWKQLCYLPDGIVVKTVSCLSRMGFKIRNSVFHNRCKPKVECSKVWLGLPKTFWKWVPVCHNQGVGESINHQCSSCLLKYTIATSVHGSGTHCFLISF